LRERTREHGANDRKSRRFHGSTIQTATITNQHSIANKQVNVYVIEHKIAVDGVPANETMQVYSINGILLVSQQSVGERITVYVKQGIYLVRLQNKVVKVVL